MSINERTIEYSYVFGAINKYAPRNLLDVGTGKTALPSLVKACGIEIAAIDQDEKQIAQNPCVRGGYCSFEILKENLLETSLTQKFDMITCISVLEHNANYNPVVQKMSEMLTPGRGILILTFPYNENEYIPNAYKLPDAGYGRDAPPTNICQMYSRENVKKWEESFGLELVDQEHWQAFTGKYWTYGSRMYPPVKTDKDGPHQLTCLALRSRG